MATATAKRLSDIETERALIGLLIQNPELVIEIDNIYLNREDFSNSHLGDVYEVIKLLQYNNDHVEPVAILAKGKELGLPFAKKEEIVNRIRTLYEEQCEQTNLFLYTNIVKNYSFKRQLFKVLDQSKNQILQTDSALESISIVEKNIYEFLLHNQNEGNLLRLGDYVDEVLEELAKDPNIGLTTGFPTLDEYLGGGCRGGTLTMIGARSGIGKSLLTLLASILNAVKGIPVLYLDTELSKEIQVIRMIGMLTGIPFRDFETGRWQRIPVAVEKYKEAKKTIDKLPLHWEYVGGMSCEQLSSIVRRFINRFVGLGDDGKYKKSLVIYDYLKLMNPKDKGDMKEYEALGHLATQLHDLAAKYGIAIIATNQLNRDGINVENSSVYAGSDRIEHLCDSAAIFKPKTREEMNMGNDQGNHKFVITKSRFGQGVTLVENGQYISVLAKKECGQFKDCGIGKILQSHDDDD